MEEGQHKCSANPRKNTLKIQPLKFSQIFVTISAKTTIFFSDNVSVRKKAMENKVCCWKYFSRKRPNRVDLKTISMTTVTIWWNLPRFFSALLKQKYFILQRGFQIIFILFRRLNIQCVDPILLIIEMLSVNSKINYFMFKSENGI